MVDPAVIVISETVPKSVPSVPVPPVPSNDTVTLAVVATDNVAVKVKDDPAFSAIEVAEVASVTVGALSFSVIVIVTTCGVPLSLADPPETVSIATIPVSLPS